MRILDLRPKTVRLMSSLWGGGSPIRGQLADDPGSGSLPGRLAGRIADDLMVRRIGGRTKAQQGPLVVSVGNLALGGTGKTPVVTTLAAELADGGRTGAILTRGFGSPLAGPLIVEPENLLAGDEARMMAGALTGSGWTVVQARRRHRGLDFLLAKDPGLDIVIVEDGHQTARVGRDLDIVILDAWLLVSDAGVNHVRPLTGPVFPFGPWRESAAGAFRAGIWLLETEEVDLPGGAGGQEVVTFQRRLTLRGPGGETAPDLSGKRPAVLSGIARPEAFESSLGRVMENEPILAVRCGDHARYAPRLVAEISGAVRGAGADFLVTTAKDWVKLEPFWGDAVPVLVADLQISWGSGKTLSAMVEERLES